MSLDQKYPYPARGWFQTHIKKLYLISILVLAPVWTWTSWQVFSSQVQTKLQQQIEADMNLFVDSLSSELEKYRFIPKMLTVDSTLSNALRHTNLLQPQHQRIDHHLAYISKVTAADEIFLLDTQGNTFASSKSNNVGTNYSKFTFFQASMAGESGGLFTLEINTGVRGYYFSEPLLDPHANQVIGIIVVKVNMSRLERGWLNQRLAFMITDEFGIVIASSVPTWLFTSRAPLDDQRKQAIIDTGRYPSISFPELQMQTLQTLSGQGILPASIIRLPKANYGKMLEINMAYPRVDWQLYGYGDLQQLSSVIQRNTLLSLLLLLLTLSLVYVATQRRLQLKETLKRREINQLRLQNAKDLLEQRVAERTQALQDSNNELKQTQQELVHAAKLATLGQMATSLTHEVNQPLTALQTCADNAEQWLAQNNLENTQHNLKKINKLSQKMASIINNLKVFGQKTDNTASLINLNEAIDNAVDLVQLRCQQERVKLHIENTRGIKVPVNLVRLEQVIINLIINALDAMLPCTNKHLHITCERQPHHIILRVTDTGPGIASEHLTQIFDPFFTTKNTGEGLGLGLSISYSIVASMDGELRARNIRNTDSDNILGAEFSLRLPARYDLFI